MCVYVCKRSEGEQEVAVVLGPVQTERVRLGTCNLAKQARGLVAGDSVNQ